MDLKVRLSKFRKFLVEELRLFNDEEFMELTDKSELSFTYSEELRRVDVTIILKAEDIYHERFFSIHLKNLNAFLEYVFGYRKVFMSIVKVEDVSRKPPQLTEDNSLKNNKDSSSRRILMNYDGWLVSCKKTKTPEELLLEDKSKRKIFPLCVYTKYSSFDGLFTSEEWAELVSSQGHKVLALTDFNNVHTFPEAEKSMKKYGLKPLYGAEIEVISRPLEIIANVQNLVLDNEIIFAIFDMETTGLNAAFDEIIEIYILRYSGGVVLDNYHSFIKCDKEVSDEIINLTKITSEKLDIYGRDKVEVLTKVREYVEGSVLIAHNGIEFDFPFLNAQLKKKLLLKNHFGHNIIFFAKNQKGLSSLYKLISRAHIECFFEKPRLMWEYVEQERENLILLSSPTNSILIDAVLQDNMELFQEEGSKLDFLSLPPPSHFLHEINRGNFSEEDVRELIRRFYEWSKLCGFKVIANYCLKYKKSNEILPNYSFRSTEKFIEEFKFLSLSEEEFEKIFFTNREALVDLISSDIQIVSPSLALPKVRGATENIREYIFNKLSSKYGQQPNSYLSTTLFRELSGITENGNCSYFQLLENFPESGFDLEEKTCPQCFIPLGRDGQNIPFETFLGLERTKVPDIDLNFSGQYQQKAHNFIRELFGKENTFRTGTISAVAEKTAFALVKHYLQDNGFTKVDLEKIEYSDKKILKMFSDISVLEIPEKNLEILEETVGTLGLPEFGTEKTREIIKACRGKVSNFSDLIRISGISHGKNKFREGKSLIKSKLNKENVEKTKYLVIIYEVVLEMISRGIKFRKVDLNQSSASTFIPDRESKTVLMPFSCIPGLGLITATQLENERNRGGEYTSRENFESRIKLNISLLKVFEKLQLFELQGNPI
ncbi:hypothetical protein PVNG_02465 [Plasmodium vivax North Korean]|uniref:DNA-directed DNA polymerase n=1 Tax=Plasmodium vivax North Korean TaxID=1035514 RepID=A0A0J9TNN0_PLAVI|nr:hypothetical protein PVNG_02465 [Plasmodium vivax North Korean]